MILATYKVTPSVQAYSGNPQQYPIPFPSILGACNRSLPSFWSPTGKALGWRQAGPWRHIASLRTEEISHIFRSTSGRIHPRPKAAWHGPQAPCPSADRRLHTDVPLGYWGNRTMSAVWGIRWKVKFSWSSWVIILIKIERIAWSGEISLLRWARRKGDSFLTFLKTWLLGVLWVSFY
jgi:hypothetical protein